MKKIFILLSMFFLLGISYAESGVSTAIDKVLKMTNEEQRKEMKEGYEIAAYEFYNAIDNLYSYKIISEKEFEERGVKYIIADVEITGPNLNDLHRILTSEYFIKMGNLYKYKENWNAFNEIVEEDTDWDKYYKKQQEIQLIIYKDLGNAVKKTKFIKEKKRYELYVVEDAYEEGNWVVFAPAESGYALYDPKIEKYLENNIEFIQEYDFSSQAAFF